MLSIFRILACLPLVGVAFANPAQAGQKELESLFAQHPDAPAANICLVRHYDAAHLKSHPNQNVTDMLVYIGKRKGEQDGYVYYNINAQVKFRDSRQNWTFSGDCGHKVGEVAPIHCGIDCDGGGYDVSLRSDKSVELKITSDIRLGDPESEEAINTDGFKSDDTTFVLKQTHLNDCLPIIDDDALKAGLSRGAITQ